MDNSFLHSKKLLLVDDEQELLKMVSDILKDAGFETVLTAPPFLITFSLHHIFENFNESKNALCRRLIFGVNRRQRRAPLFFQIVP